MIAKINGTEIFFDIDGAGYVPRNGVLYKKPVCFVLHGGPGESHGYFKPFLNDLTRDMQLIYIDNRGSGFSKQGLQSSYSLENNVEDVEALRSYLGLDKIWILGHSYGGMMAQAYALKYQQNLAGLILVTTASSYRFLEKAKKYVWENGTEEQKQFAQVLFNGEFKSNAHVDAYYETMATLYVHDGQGINDLSEMEVLSELDRSYEALNEGFGGFLRKFDLTERLSEINVPTLVVAGRYDWITPVEENELIAEQIVNSEFVIMEDSSHAVMEEEMDAFNQIVSQFVRKHHNP